MLSYFVGDGILDEAGTGLTAWLFDGQYPELIHLDDPTLTMELWTGLFWVQQERESTIKPRERYYDSIPMAHIQRIMSQRE